MFLPAVGAAGGGAVLVLSDGEDALVVLDLFFGDVLQEDVVERWPVQDNRRVPTAVLLEKARMFKSVKCQSQDKVKEVFFSLC